MTGRARAAHDDDAPATWRARGAALVHYLALSAAGHLVWETAQLPLYGIWHTGTADEIVFAVAHCTTGDLLIAASTLVLAAALAGAGRWPLAHYARVASIAIALGLLYTIYSEFQNVYVRQSWSYAAWMPTIDIGGHAIGAAPLLQWIVVPLLAFRIGFRRLAR